MNVLPIAADIDKRAAALAHVHEMNETIIRQDQEIAQLKADLNRVHDRCSMLLEERDRYRHSDMRWRKTAIRQAVEMVNAALILERGKDSLLEMDEIDEAPTPPTVAIEKLAAEFEEGNK